MQPPRWPAAAPGRPAPRWGRGVPAGTATAVAAGPQRLQRDASPFPALPAASPPARGLPSATRPDRALRLTWWWHRPGKPRTVHRPDHRPRDRHRSRTLRSPALRRPGWDRDWGSRFAWGRGSARGLRSATDRDPGRSRGSAWGWEWEMVRARRRPAPRAGHPGGPDTDRRHRRPRGASPARRSPNSRPSLPRLHHLPGPRRRESERSSPAPPGESPRPRRRQGRI